ncbi:hypothetical protein SAMN05720606_10199 [Paenibacillus polysaccharolyticus]|uniref:Uncharacterized protein n=1 Tax=Paenibacillus polysaccharolyticus TaxID=582692 RepID=A0A1G5ATI2_9BACL|nr:hypothetical protein [Paenibacillus polysaccharolyticus]SCX81198.1 hypothetical protein SAMN05720606_10199 [Paenibacillus polysaccharolyticus]
MSFIHLITKNGEFSIETILINEGFTKTGQIYHFQKDYDESTIFISVDHRTFTCELKSLQGTTIKRAEVNFQKDSFFERYAVLIGYVQKFLTFHSTQSHELQD